MKRSVLTMVAIAALAGVALLPATSEAFGRRKASCCEIAPPCGAAPCAAPCAPVVAPAPAPVQYRDVTVTKYKQVMVEKQIVELVCKTITKEVPYTYNVCTPVVTPTKKLVNVCKIVTKEVPYTYTVMVPRTVQEKVLCTTYQCITEVVTKQVPVCKIVRVPCVDACGNCTYVCQRVTEMQTVSCNVVKRVPVQTERIVNKTICEPVLQKGTKMVCEYVTVQQEVTVNVCTYKTDVVTAKRLVCEVVTEKVARKVQVCQVTPYTETIRVPVEVPCATTSCSEGCAEPAGHHVRRGLFHRGSCSSCK